MLVLLTAYQFHAAAGALLDVCADAYNTWTNNAASGGFAGFSFPHAPRPIKDHRTLKKASGPNSGYPFDPSQRPFILFKGNTVHSTGYFWEHSGGIYFGGMIFYKTDPSDGQIKVSRLLMIAGWLLCSHSFMSCIICFWPKMVGFQDLDVDVIGLSAMAHQKFVER